MAALSIAWSNKVAEVQITTLIELLMIQAVKLESVPSDGDTSSQKNLQKMLNPICLRCLRANIVTTAHTANNNGRRYYNCTTTNFGFVGWCDDAIFHQVQTQFMLRLFEEKMNVMYLNV
ncbi:hypothetical protein FCM35_KLT06939 [Carex littledalei]|uniref:Zinc finger GRF-type domain-containing protein n=1 Tax=Carex littledalei TaxID=544730 RepID=A0A833VM45_9POAL|nr:hypothetical protein FCM35_KLT06939 [Carex littledalei]